MVLFDIYSFAIVGLYLWQKLVENDKVLPTKVLKLISVSPSAWQLTLGMTGNGSRNFKAGDFFFISFPKVKGLSKEAHPFSLTNAPIDSDRQLVFTIRKLGDFTKKTFFVESWRYGSCRRTVRPFSSIIDNKKEADLIFIGMGTGIAPLLSLSRQYQNQRRIKVVWTVKNLNEAYYDQIFEKMKSDSFEYHMQAGRIKAKQIDELFSEKELRSGLFFVVGPAFAIISLENSLKKHSVSKDRLIDERLTM
ncbi:hypothetical protein Q757_08395 [Oenococcus alcoholitolerans]|uniref:FAD-binding FR-type domain-containing protein n=1 Tax=Oenococcus alcoholitolerans TaxID=931074 RepID=A0ABR4XQ18_9LACO|nr:hypothetical protein Q757_08395 [Oenococcus alcoholitolerans]